MKTSEYAGMVMALLCMAGMITVADAAEPAASPTTLWSFLGIPQGINKIRDVTTNRRGNFPGLERKPPLKSIADPSNLELKEPEVIKKAAEIKTEEDKAPQKIKAIKYLAKVGCGGCYEGVGDALLSALGDCTEKVRYEAAKAFSKAAGDPCEVCGGTGCCNAKTMTKLYELAYAKDEEGCYKESSARVRTAARNALRACRRVVPMVPAPVPEPGPIPEPARGPKPEVPRKERLPKEALLEEPKPEGDLLQPEATPNGDEPLRPKDQESLEPTPAIPSKTESSSLVNPITFTGMIQARQTRSAYRLAGFRPVAPPGPGFPRKYVGQAKEPYRQLTGFSGPRKADTRRAGQSKRMVLLPPPPRK